MARKTSSRLAKRREVEAADSQDGATKKKKKRKATRKKSTTSRRKLKSKERKQLVWGVFSGSLKEEARFPYDQRAEADAKLEQLRSRGKKLYFIQPIKEVITTPAPSETEEPADAE